MPENQSAGRNLQRTNLWQVAPRSVPFAIGLAPSDLCNFRCVYCNQSTPAGIADAQVLKWEDFLTITHQIEALLDKGSDDLKIIRLIGNGEPLINPRLPDMVAYLAEKQYAPRIEVTTNASLLTPQVSDALIGAGLTRLLVSVQGTTTEKYRQVCGYPMDMEQFLRQIEYFYRHKKQCGLYVKIIDLALDGPDDEQRFYDMFRPISDIACVENVMEAFDDVDYTALTGRDIHDTNRYGGEFRQRLCCNSLFININIHSNGDADCCGCKYPPLFFGNVYRTPLHELWNGTVHRSIMEKHLLGQRDRIPLCRDCAFSSYNTFPEDDLDDHLDEIYRRLFP